MMDYPGPAHLSARQALAVVGRGALAVVGRRALAVVGRAAVTVCLLCGVLLGAAAGAGAAPNAIQVENSLPGTTAWELPGDSPTDITSVSTHIQGYASQVSVQPGDTLALHVGTNPAAPYRVEIYRLGWYQGKGGRLITCLPTCTGAESGQVQPVPAPDPNTGYLDAGWPVTDSVTVGQSWVSGYYLAKLVLTGGPYAGAGSSGGASWVPFIVRPAPGTASAIQVQAAVNTWQAYNNWGGKSLYAFNSTSSYVPASKTNEAAMVSFNRPYANPTDPFQWEYQLVRYLEREGFDVTYTTDADVDANPGTLLGHRLDVVNGHDEYWSPGMRNAWEAARAAGVNLAFVGANIGYWQARYSNSDRTLIEYRNAALDPYPVPSQRTTQFRQAPVNRPECQLLGIGYPGGLVKPGDPARSYTVTSAGAAHPWFARTGLTAGTVLSTSVGQEWDMIIPGCSVPPLTDLLHFAGLPQTTHPNPADAVTYTAPSGARVFSSGSLQLVWMLDDWGHGQFIDARVQTLFGNIFSSLAGPPGPPSGAPVLLSPAPRAATRSPVDLRWSAPPGYASYSVQIDGRAPRPVPAADCAATCAFPVHLPEGLHRWAVVGLDAFGTSTTSATRSFLVDNTPPRRFRLLSPAARALLWSPLPRLHWKRARDKGSGVAFYAVRIDGKVALMTRRTAVRPPRPLADGWHTWQVIAFDRAGNARASVKRRFLVRSVRVASQPRSRLRARGVLLDVYCVHRCTVGLVLRAAPGASALATLSVRLAPGVGHVRAAEPALLHYLRSRPQGRLAVTARVRDGGRVRVVRLSFPW